MNYADQIMVQIMSQPVAHCVSYKNNLKTLNTISTVESKLTSPDKITPRGILDSESET